jgi:hypothetical protein
MTYLYPKKKPMLTLSALEKYGVCVFRNFLSPEQISKVQNEFDPIFEAKKDNPKLFPEEPLESSVLLPNHLPL